MTVGDGQARRTTVRSDAARSVPWRMRVAAALSWRFLLIIAAIGVIFYILGYLSAVAIPVGIALLVSALFAPLVGRLVRWHVPRGLATLIAIVVGLIVVGGVLTLVITTLTASLPQLQEQISASLARINDWLQRGPLHLSHDQLQQMLNKTIGAINGNSAELASRALSTATTIGTILTQALLALFTLIFFLYSGPQVWSFLLRIVPHEVRDQADVAGRRGFASLVSYVRATVAVACVDAICIGVGIWIVGVPLAVPLAALIFIGAFVPIIGAVASGAVAVLIALVAKGFVAALIVLAILIGVMQLESHVLQPFLLGRAVRLHPLAVVLAIAVGVEVSGITGALLAVPILAVLKSAIGSLLRDPNELDPHDVNALRPRNARPLPDQQAAAEAKEAAAREAEEEEDSAGAGTP
ncbi:putative PurR-regulated permease PerM [Amycolatopsis bartoniae]|uniref:AI-2E family transporter n=1 Tax=Amycolatopsis bartoniae TaxID=941986 RepID=A0A8H9IW46_9PSEU|nr:AI-2E family transporter [Amycolatopsis bartoniae]MBB2939325.1 putative PurR-regulated permease PerM [Amycolatopsis bartoniae]TVT08774.1 AI-2E family transporter [Amycolatopsis bartoniae]GHF37297.1 AI-2E family transporter [Amycolatopsis bartoniae]